MNNRFIRRGHKTITAMALLTSLVMLGGCFSDNENWNSKDISGLMPELAFELTGTSGDTVTAAQTDGNIRLLFFGFTSCPDICPATLQKLSRAVKNLPSEQRAETQIMFISVDPRRDTPERIDSYVSFFSDRAVGLTGDEPALRELSKRYRTTFGYDEPDAEGNYNVSHSGAVYVFDREGSARLLIRPEVSVEAIQSDLMALAEES